ncbi:predicted protein [Chaetoceros tenuissimus]|uniref:Uncharacterized protein n=1 Tax=Chaetoceros tenuissimus TaxID=426638 RepID=A0AAD3CUH4_9STRA|nr:predicted protein [Chaetoceros tenuissimus]
MGNPLAELGLASDDGSLTVDHAIVLSMSKTMEESLRHTLLALSKTSKETSKMLKIVGYAASAYLVMCGVARIIEASKRGSSENKK